MSRFEDDEEIERRLQAMGRAATPMPASIGRYLRQLPGEHPVLTSRSRLPNLAGISRPRLIAGGLAAVAAIALVAVVSAPLLIPPNRTASSPSPSVSPSASSAPSATPSATPSASPVGQRYNPENVPADVVTTPGLGPGTPWTGLKVDAIPAGSQSAPNALLNGSVVHWSGGWILPGEGSTLPAAYIWESSDALTWHAVGAPGSFVVPSAAGLTIMSDDLSKAWVSADGLYWSALDTAGLDGLTFDPPWHAFNLAQGGPAGSPVGMVAPACPPVPGARCVTTSLRFSATGETWQDVTPKVDGTVKGWVTGWLGTRFAALGVLTARGAGSGKLVAYSSSDGRSWTPAAIPDITFKEADWENYRAALEVARGGAIYPGLNFWLTTTDGSSWTRDDNDGPLGKGGANIAKGNGELYSNTDSFLARTGAGQAWTSFDGRSWTKLTEPLPVLEMKGISLELNSLLPRGLVGVSNTGPYYGTSENGAATSPAPPTPTTSSGPLPPAGPGLNTPGITSGWTDFTWRGAPAGLAGMGQVLRWRGGYVATNASVGSSGIATLIWTSPDGQTWTQIKSIKNDEFMVSVAPAGLIALGFDASALGSPPLAVWASSDGVTWHNLGKPNLDGQVGSIAGTSSGIVATMGCPNSTCTSLPSQWVDFSTDGLHWTTQAAGGVAFAQFVQTNGDHFYMMGMPAATAGVPGFVLLGSKGGAQNQMWLSDDGRNWRVSGGGFAGDAAYIDFGRDGLLVHTSLNGTSGGVGQAYSTDGGMTWHDDTGFGPLGAVPCTFGACDVAPNGVIGSNGTTFVAVKKGGQAAWVSYDGRTWTAIPWTRGSPAYVDSFAVLPRGVLLNEAYGAGQ
jgi:hypothetical protein